MLIPNKSGFWIFKYILCIFDWVKQKETRQSIAKTGGIILIIKPAEEITSCNWQ